MISVNSPISRSSKKHRNITLTPRVARVSLPDDFVSEGAPAEDVPVSPFGFGPYPEVPVDYTARHGQTVWQYPGSLPLYDQRNIELLHRVMIASWNDGDTDFMALHPARLYFLFSAFPRLPEIV